MVSKTGAVLGVDVGWSSSKKTTGVCLLRWTSDVVRLEPTRVRWQDFRAAQFAQILALAIDGPVRGDLRAISEYRAAERLLTRGLSGRIGKPGQSSSGNGAKLNAGANRVVKRMLSTGKLGLAKHKARIHERSFVDAFPTSFLGVMLDESGVPEHGSRSDVYFRHLLGPNGPPPSVPESDRLLGLLDRLLPGRRLEVSLNDKVTDHCGEIRDHDERAAVVCAFTALCIAARKYVAVGESKNGYIILPPRADAGKPGLQPWAWDIINRAKTPGDEIVVE